MPFVPVPPRVTFLSDKVGEIEGQSRRLCRTKSPRLSFFRPSFKSAGVLLLPRSGDRGGLQEGASVLLSWSTRMQEEWVAGGADGLFLMDFHGFN